MAACDAYYYYYAFEKLVTQWPECWHLCALADDRARSEHFERVRRQLELDAAVEHVKRS